MSDRLLEVQRLIYKYLPDETDAPSDLFAAMNYSVKNGGKRLRPILMTEAFLAFGGNPADIEDTLAPFMAAIEMIHSYSLVHDDLPEIDNDMYRRGNLTTHAAYGPAMGVFAGDALLNYAFETMNAAVKAAAESGDINRTLRLAKASEILGRKAGAYGMVGGQAVDIKYTGGEPTDDDLELIYVLKTSALLEASLMAGAVIAGAGDEVTEGLEKVGHNTGLAFQIRDDILDVTGDEKVIGKPVNSDEDNNKTTYVTKHGVDAAQKKVDELTTEAESILAGLNPKGKELGRLLSSLVNRNK